MNQSFKKILVIEDEEKIVSVLKSFLESKGFFVICANNGKQALDLFNSERISLVLLDLMIPELSGEEVCKTLRQKSKVPIIMLTAKSKEEDMLNGLGIGADDYITKPFSLKALYARIEAVMRRAGDTFESENSIKSYKNKDLTIDYDSRIVTKQNVEVKLTPNEYKILATLTKHPNKVFTRDELIASAFGDEFEGFDRTIDSHIKNLRAKIEDDTKNPTYVKTVHGVGYKFGGE
ncbi:response regulator transcription factor [Mobilitalea sibirica]|uniref:Stage 0 sporulation protein A homolog n=1 Tax=Mobilitalea sibirica TaxID=1462919 RepID=A0A8J7KVG9_9FIRM|nr:response regulator transcription factor [Mobilitalea sibirica]MBH1940150.1 response regulator transcription factor [Mobilitalea sibirica]